MLEIDREIKLHGKSSHKSIQTEWSRSNSHRSPQAYNQKAVSRPQESETTSRRAPALYNHQEPMRQKPREARAGRWLPNQVGTFKRPLLRLEANQIQFTGIAKLRGHSSQEEVVGIQVCNEARRQKRCRHTGNDGHVGALTNDDTYRRIDNRYFHDTILR